MTESDVWALVPTLTQAEALALLALARIEHQVGPAPHTAIEVVAATTGANVSTTAATLRALAKAGHVVQVPYIGVDKSGGDCLRKGYRTVESGVKT